MSEEEITAIRQRLGQRSPGHFHFPEVYGDGWDDLPVGEKVRIGREFLTAVREGRFNGVEDTGRKVGGGRVYLLRRA